MSGSRSSKPIAEGPPKELVREKFARQAERYAAERESQPGFVQQRDIALSWLPPEAGVALEVGCGAVGVFAEMDRLGWQVVGIDISAEMIAGARQRASRLRCGCVTLMQGDAENLGFRDDSFDVVVVMGVMEYLRNPDAALRELHRVLRPGGRCILSVPLEHSPDAWTSRLYRGLPMGLRNRLLGRARGTTRPDFEPLGFRPRRLDRTLASHGLIVQNRAFAHFEIFPFDRLAPRCSASFSRWVAGRAHLPLLRRLGRQYLVGALASAVPEAGGQG